MNFPTYEIWVPGRVKFGLDCDRACYEMHKTYFEQTGQFI